VLQAIKIVREPEQQGLATLGEQASSGSAAREFTFGHGEDGSIEGSPKDEVGVMHDLVKDGKSKYKLKLKTKSSEPRHQAKMPIGYDSDPATD
jgi:hypothetical protein